MSKGSLANAYKVLGRKPILILLLLPLQAVSTLISKIVPGASANPTMIPAGWEYLLAILIVYGGLFLLSTLRQILLLPPAMVLLQDGAAGQDTPPGWYSLGLKKHWWKPIALGAMELSIQIILIVVFYILLFIFVFIFIGILAAGIDNLLSSPEPTPITLLSFLIPCVPFTLVLIYVNSFFSLMLPALADRSFGAAFKLAFSKRGMKKIIKLAGVQLLIGFVSFCIYFAFGFGYVLLSGSMPDSFTGAMEAFSTFGSTWTGYFAVLLISLPSLYLYAYQFCLMEEVRKEEAADRIRIEGGV